MQTTIDAAQRVYDAMTPDMDVEMPQIEACEKAIELLTVAVRQYGQFIPKVNAGDGCVEDAMAELRKIVGDA